MSGGESSGGIDPRERLETFLRAVCQERFGKDPRVENNPVDVPLPSKSPLEDCGAWVEYIAQNRPDWRKAVWRTVNLVLKPNSNFQDVSGMIRKNKDLRSEDKWQQTGVDPQV